jgi:dienelactone hydrolase
MEFAIRDLKEGSGLNHAPRGGSSPTPREAKIGTAKARGVNEMRHGGVAVPPTEPGAAGLGPDELNSGDEVVEHLRGFARIEDETSGSGEEQAFVSTTDGPVFVTFVEPLGARREVAFLICHSFAYEQLDLFSLDLTFARKAASSGFPTLYFQARGYADSGGDFGRATPATHLRDAIEVAGWLRRRAGVQHVVPVGARWGAGIALVAARRLDAPGVVLWNPALEPGAYLDDLLKVFSRSRISWNSPPNGEPPRPTRALHAVLASGAAVDLFGYPLTPLCYREASTTHPREPAGPTPERALIVVVNPRTSPDAEALAEELSRLGVEARVDHSEGPGRAQFGLGASPATPRLVASQPLYRDVADRTIRWAEEVWPAAARLERLGSSAAAAEIRTSRGSAIHEMPVYIRSRTGWLGAVVTAPEDRRSSIGVVLLAGRASGRTHLNGLWVKTAGALAEHGMYALRLDYPGVGNSTGSPQIYGMKDMPSWAVVDACRFLLEHTPVRSVFLVGTCYGARVVLDAAPRIPAVTDVALVAAPVALPRSKGGLFRSKAGRLRRLVGAVAQEGRDGRSGRPVSERERRRRPLDPAFVGSLRRFLPQGHVRLLYGDGDVAWGELRRVLDRLRLPADRLEIELLPGEIHSFRSTAIQALTRERVAAWCKRSAEALRGPG